MSGSLPSDYGNITVANPLDVYTKTLQARKAGLDIQGVLSDRAWGAALQQATDENGNVDYPKAQSIAAHDPHATQGMLRALPITSTLTGEQQDNIKRNMTTVAQHGATLGIDPSDNNVNDIVDDLERRGYPKQQGEDLRTHLLSMRLPDGSPDLTRRAQFGARAQLGAMDAASAAARTGGTTSGQDVGGEIKPYTLRQNIPGYSGASMTPAPGGAGKTLTPGEASSYGIVYKATQEDVDAGRAAQVGADVHVPGFDVVKRFGYGGMLPPGAQLEAAPPATGGSTGGVGVTDSTGKKVGPTNPPRLLKVPGAPPATAPPATSSTAAPAAAPAATSPPATSPAAPQGVPVTANPLTPPGVQVASANAAFAPPVGPPGPVAPGTAGDVNVLLAGVNAARTARGAPPIVPAASFSVGPGYQSDASAKATAASSADKLAADDKLAGNYAATVFPQAQALSLLGRGITTAPNTDFLNRMRGNVRGFLGQFGINTFDSTKEYDELHKWLTQIVVSNPVATGSDARLAETLAGNANTGIHELASTDMMKAGIALTRMQVAANSEWHSLPPTEQAQYGGSYMNFLRDYNKRVDPRAFAWDMFNTEQKKTLADDIKNHDQAYAQKFLDTRDLARRNGLLDETRAMP